MILLTLKYVLQSNTDDGTTIKRSMDPFQVPIGVVTKARDKRFKVTLYGLIQCIWAKESSYRSKGDSTRVPQGWMSIIQAWINGRWQRSKKLPNWQIESTAIDQTLYTEAMCYS